MLFVLPATAGLATRGLLAGLLATVPSTAFMVTCHQTILPATERYPLPFRIALDSFYAKTNVLPKPMPQSQLAVISAVMQFAGGAALGALFPKFLGLDASISTSPWYFSGAVYGLLSWMSTYAVAFPLTGLLTPAYRVPPGRNFLMISGHVVWGLVLSWLFYNASRF